MEKLDIEDIFFRTRQFGAHADDIALVATSVDALEDICRELDAETWKTGLLMTTGKTEVSDVEQRRRMEDIEIGVFNF